MLKLCEHSTRTTVCSIPRGGAGVLEPFYDGGGSKSYTHRNTQNALIP